MKVQKFTSPVRYEVYESQIEDLQRIQKQLEESDQYDAAQLIGNAIVALCELIPDRIRDVFCPQCKKDFILSFQEEYYGERLKTTLAVRSCPSGGVYSVEIRCPHCNYEEPT